MLKKLVFLIALLYSITLVTVCLIRIENLPNGDIPNVDKIYHFLAYAVFVVLWYTTVLINFNLKKRKRTALIYIFIFAILFGLVIEVLQDRLTNYRALDVYDILANSLGAFSASIVLGFKNQLYVKTIEDLFF